MTKNNEQQTEGSEQLISDLLNVMAKLRSQGGCPWDREQTHETLKPFLLEECGEFMDAIDDQDISGMCEELGDLCLHIVFHSQIAKENGTFTFDDVVKGVTEKLRRRHPHVFGDQTAANATEVLDIWQTAKDKENKEGRTSLVDGVPRNMSALLRAEKIQKKAAKVGFDWSDASQIVDKIDEEVHELKTAISSGDEDEIDEEIGDLLFSVVNLQRFRKGKTSEELLEKTIQKFYDRFQHIEKTLKERSQDIREASIDELEALWVEAKTSL